MYIGTNILQKLEPIENKEMLTPEKVEEKLKQAEENRKKVWKWKC